MEIQFGQIMTRCLFVTSSDGRVMHMGGFATNCKPVQVQTLHVPQMLGSPKTAQVNALLTNSVSKSSLRMNERKKERKKEERKKERKHELHSLSGIPMKSV